jgi:hypothetical protein
MIRFVLLAWCLMSLVHAAESTAPALQLENDGIGFTSSAVGHLTLGWPTLQDAKYQRTKTTGAQRAADGRSAVLAYPGGGQVTVSLTADGFTLAVDHQPESTEALCLELVLPAAVRQDGAWTCDAANGKFPADKPADAHFFSGHAKRFQLASSGKRVLAITAPEYSFQQLTDNREWNWDAYSWLSAVPVAGDGQSQHYVVSF